MRALCRAGEWIIGIDPSSKPAEAMIEVTTRCNYSCLYCFRKIMNEPYRDMSYSLFTKIVDKLSSAGVRKIVLSGWGEPLVHPRIDDMIIYAKERGMRIILNTNGSLLQSHIDTIIEAPVDQIVVSIDAPEEKEYRRTRAGKEGLNTVTKALQEIRKAKIKRGQELPEVRIHYTITRTNIEWLREMPSYAREVGASHIILSNVLPLTQEMEENIACYSSRECIERLERILEDIGRHGIDFSQGITVIPPSMSPVVERRCPFVSRKALFVRVDGRVAPCIYYAHTWRNTIHGIERRIEQVILGDLGRENAIDIWHKPEYAAFRMRAYFFALPSCLDCRLEKYCTYTTSNISDCWGNTPTCSHCPYSHDMVRCPL